MERYQDTALDFTERADDLLARMAIREKLLLLIETSPENQRLGIPKYDHGNEALHGVVRPGRFTVFPQAIALGATFDEDLVHEIAAAISDEARARHHNGREDLTAEETEARFSGLLTFWSPDLNLARDPRWGRTGETYGEDPYLAGRLGIAFIRGLQGDDPRYLKTVATPKHFTANNEEHNRFSCNAIMSEKTLREYHLAPFRDAVIEGGCAAVMAAYNAINGIPCHASKKLLTDTLRSEWGFAGYAVSDCSGIARLWDQHKQFDQPGQAAAAAMNAGIDLECGGYSPYEHFYVAFLEEQIEKGFVTMARVDQACRRVLSARFRLGQFDPPGAVPWSGLPKTVIGCEKHRELAYRAACRSLVLLKNNGILPLRPDQKTAVIGNNAAICQLGDYSGKPVQAPISPLAGIAAIAGENCLYAPWSYRSQLETYAAVESDFIQALTGEYYGNTDFLGQPRSRADRNIDFSWNDAMPDPVIATPRFSVRWSGHLSPPVSGDYDFRLVWSGSLPCEPPVLAIEGTAYGQSARVSLRAGESVSFKVWYAKSADHPAIRLEWQKPRAACADPFEQECAIAGLADQVIAVVGLGVEYEREGKDKDTLDLPREQMDMLERVYAVNKNLIAVLINGSPLSIPWVQEHAAAVIEAWYPGEQGGRALADILYGQVNPSGRLCVSFPYQTEDLPAFDSYNMEEGRTYLYCKKPPLYPFGFGLSYTTFQYAGLSCDTVGHASVTVRNAGRLAGSETVQFYLDSAGRSGQPRWRLVGIRRIYLGVGESQDVAYDLTDRSFSLIDSQGRRMIYPGVYTLYAGGSQPDQRSVELGVPMPARRPVKIEGDAREMPY